MFTSDFEVTQSQDGKSIVIKDISVYADPDTTANIASRSLTITAFDGNAPAALHNPISFPIVTGQNDTISLTIDKDYAISITQTQVPIEANEGSVYEKRKDVILQNGAKAKLYDREVRLIAGLVSCEGDYADVNYSILRWIDSSYNRYLFSDQLGAQRLLDKITSIGINDCVC